MSFTRGTTFQNPTQNVQDIRASLATQASELRDLSETYESREQKLFALEPEIILKAKGFIAAAQTPMDFTWSIIGAAMGAAVIRTLVHVKALQAIPHSGGATVETIAEATSAQQSLVERLLRAAVSIGFLSFDSQTKEFKHTHVSVAWTEPANLASDAFSFIYDTGLAPMVLLPDWLQHNDPTQAAEPIGDKARTHNPLTYRHGTEGHTVFETMAKQPETVAVFSRILGAVGGFRPFIGIYPWERLADPDPARPLFVDVGGGTGQAISAILAAHPDLPASGFVLQELPGVISQAESKNTTLPTGVHFQAHDFFTQNPVKGAKAYHIRACLHDWPDSTCVEILRNIVPAMAADSRVLIAESLLPEDPYEDEGGFMGFQDMLMLCIGGKERTREGFRQVVEEAGLVIEQVWEGDEIGRFVIVECRLPN